MLSVKISLKFAQLLLVSSMLLVPCAWSANRPADKIQAAQREDEFFAQLKQLSSQTRAHARVNYNFQVPKEKSLIPIGDFDLDETWVSLAQMQRRHLPNFQFIGQRQQLRAMKVYQLIIKWLWDLNCTFNMNNQTFELSVNYFLRFVETKRCNPDEMLRYALASYITATKYEEIWPLKYADVVKLVGTHISKEQLIKAMQDLNTALSLSYYAITPGYVLNALLQEMSATPELTQCANFLLYEGYMSTWAALRSPTKVAAAVLLAAQRKSRKYAPWPGVLMKRAVHLADWDNERNKGSVALYEMNELQLLIESLLARSCSLNGEGVAC